MVDETFSIHYIKELWWRHWHPPTSNKGNNVQLYQGTANWVISLNRVSVRGSSIFYKMQTTTAIVSSQKSILCSAAPGQSFKGILVGNQTPQGWVKPNSDSSPPEQVSPFPTWQLPQLLLLVKESPTSEGAKALYQVSNFQVRASKRALAPTAPTIK